MAIEREELQDIKMFKYQKSNKFRWMIKPLLLIKIGSNIGIGGLRMGKEKKDKKNTDKIHI